MRRVSSLGRKWNDSQGRERKIQKGRGDSKERERLIEIAIAPLGNKQKLQDGYASLRAAGLVNYFPGIAWGRLQATQKSLLMT